MNHEQNNLEAAATPAGAAREPYQTPRLTSYGSFRLTAATTIRGGPQPEGESEFVSDGDTLI